MNTLELRDKIQRHLNYLEQDQTNVNLLLGISNGYRQLGEWDSAQSYLNQAKKHSGRSLHNEQGLLYLDSDQILLAKESLNQAVSEEDTPIHRYHLAYCLYLNHEFAEALQHLKTQEAVNLQIDLLKAKLLIHLQATEEALDLLDQLSNQYEQNDELAGLMALLHLDNSNLEEAERFSNRALTLNEHNSEGTLVRILLKSLRNETTVAELESMLAERPGECRLWFALGAIQMQHMNYIAAEQAFAHATKLWPDFYDCWISAGWCYVFQDKLDKAEYTYQQAIRIHANGAEGWGGLALIMALTLKTVEAEELLEKTLALDPNSFLAAVARIMITNVTDPKLAGQQLNATFPQIAEEMNQILDQMKENKTIH